MPANFRQAALVHRDRKELPTTQDSMPLAELDHAFPETVKIAVPFCQHPIEAAGLVVLAVGVVVASVL
jgi:hypothetical protein